MNIHWDKTEIIFQTSFLIIKDNFIKTNPFFIFFAVGVNKEILITYQLDHTYHTILCSKFAFQLITVTVNFVRSISFIHFELLQSIMLIQMHNTFELKRFGKKQ